MKTYTPDVYICSKPLQYFNIKNIGLVRNFRDFFVDYVKAWNQGRRDFGNLIKLAFAPCA